MTDFPFVETQRRAAILSSQGRDIYQKFTCAGCGRRITRNTPGLFLETGVCKCGRSTDLRRVGCNYEVK